MTPRDLLACAAAVGLSAVYFGSIALIGWEIVHHEAIHPIAERGAEIGTAISIAILNLNIGVGLDSAPKTTSTTASITASTSTNEPLP